MSGRKCTKVLCVCIGCGKSFLIYPSAFRQGRGRFCGPGCYTASLGTITKPCQTCGKTILARSSEIKRGSAKFCSSACYIASRTIPIIDRFFRHVGRKQSNGCIPWTGYTNPSGYGELGSGGQAGRKVGASRVSYELFVGPIPDGMMVCHHCDNPTCIFPVHLFIGTGSDNMADMVAKGRARKRTPGSRRYLQELRPAEDKVLRGEKSPCAKLTAEKVLAIRAAISAGESQSQIARQFGVVQQTISAVVTRARWNHV
jgi:predicted DNA-binding protein (UPF0251 family)